MASDSITDEFAKKGYLNVARTYIDSISPNEYEQYFYLGNRYTTVQLDYNFNDLQNIDVSTLSRKRNSYTSIDQWKGKLEQLQNDLTERGYPFSQVEVKEWDFSKTDTAIAKVSVSSGQPRKINSIVVQGYPSYPKNVIQNFLLKNESYTPRNIDRIIARVEKTPYLESQRAPEALFKRDSTLLYLYLKKKNINTADGLLGFATDEDGELELNGYLDARLVNNFNLGETINFNYRNDQGDQSRLRLATDFPLVIKRRIGLGAELLIVRRDSLYQNTNIEATASYPLNPVTNILLTYINKQSNATTTIAQLPNESFASNGTRLEFRLSEIGSATLQPENLTIAISAGLQERELQDSSDFQYQLETTLLKLWEFNSRWNFLSQLNGALLKTENLQFNELYQLGGAGTIRGFNSNSIDTGAFLTVQTELRYALNDQIYAHTILDAGVFEEFVSRNPQYLYSFGAGFGILTRAGTLKIGVTNGRFIEANQGISSTIAHINLVVSF
jgi:outer membrane protein assembly factor BamA